MNSSQSDVPLAGWQEFLAAYGAGGVLEGQVTEVMPFGALVDVGNGVHGLLPRAAWSAAPRVGAGVRVRIDVVDLERRRVSLAQV